jgi:hypothetical protein
MTTTAAAIRSACLSTIEGLTPRSLSSDRFERHREDRSGGATFEEWLVTSHNQMRRFSLFDTGVRMPPAVSNADIIRDQVIFTLYVAYPVTNRYGIDGGRSLEDVIDEDQRQIDHAIGLHGSGNIPADAVYLTRGGRWDRIGSAEGDFILLVGTLPYEFVRACP